MKFLCLTLKTGGLKTSPPQATSEELQVGSNDDDQAIQGKLAEHKRCKAKAQEEAWLAEEAQLEAERQEQAWLKEERAHTEAEVEQVEAVHKAAEAQKVAESWWADALVGSSTGAGSNVKVMNPHCLRCAWTNTTCLHNTDSKQKCLACNQCNKLKEHCQWLVEGETGTGANLVIDKGKRKANVMSPHTSEKKKRSWHPSAKVLEGAGDKEDDMEEGPSTKKTSAKARASPVTSDQMEHLIKAVECVADNVVSLTVAQWEASRNFYWFSQSYEMYIKEHFEFLAPDMPSDQDTTDEEDKDIEGLDEELEGLKEEEEESRSQSESGDQTSASSAGSQV
ncbi:hypothetical protein M404DRAFT_33301 [Pisolithus tinctorius Marx 270]|uniref:Uncharacterized protein n=1 Tax=Pisolithus tinctorius Marx 270 TaxID=870435 RepID=A0A0C3NLB8_PISTI|nr:hypothetical protein M404DRAFT_33301 [Pisolithus tinctorius Marx 270]